jgi:hypothetical protein
MKKTFLILILFLINGCASTGIKNESQLGVDSKELANVYIYRQSGFLYMGVRAIIKLNNQEVGSIYPKDFLKFYAPEGKNIITVAGDPLALVFGKTNIEINFEKGKSYYFITGVNQDNVIGAVIGGAIGSAIVGGPFPSHQVTKEVFDSNKGK